MALAALVAGLVHAASLRCLFNADDFNLLRAVRDGGPLGIWAARGGGFFRPLSSFSLWFDDRLFGTAAWGYHLVNVVLAMLAAALVALLARRLAPSAPAWAAAASGIAFALMPAHAEAVEWVACRSDLLAAVFSLGALVSGLRGGWRMAAGLTALGLAAKESALMVPVVLGLLALGGERTGRATLASGIAAALMVGLRGFVLGTVVGGYGTSFATATLSRNLGLYFAKALLPTSVQEALLSPAASVVGWVLSHPLPVALAVVVLVALGLLRLRTRMGRRGKRLAGLLFLGFFALALPALPLGMSAYTWEGSRFVYLPSATLAVLLGLGLTRLRPAVACAVGAALAVSYLEGDFRALEAWRIAGERARNSISTLAPIRGRVLLLSVPDSYRGAYILRNGLESALALEGKGTDALPLTSWMSETPDDFPKVVPGGVEVARGPLPLQKIANAPERVAAFGAAGVRVGRFAIDAGPPGLIPRAVLLPDRLVAVP